MTIRPTERQATLRFGFTLLEVILALAMVSLVALSLYASLQTACKARERASLSIEPARAASVSMELFRQDVESALTPNGILAGPFIGRRAGPWTLSALRCSQGPGSASSQWANRESRSESAILASMRESAAPRQK